MTTFSNQHAKVLPFTRTHLDIESRLSQVNHQIRNHVREREEFQFDSLAHFPHSLHLLCDGFGGAAGAGGLTAFGGTGCAAFAVI
jgi:hypothetical protein